LDEATEHDILKTKVLSQPKSLLFIWQTTHSKTTTNHNIAQHSGNKASSSFTFVWDIQASEWGLEIWKKSCKEKSFIAVASYPR